MGDHVRYFAVFIEVTNRLVHRVGKSSVERLPFGMTEHEIDRKRRKLDRVLQHRQVFHRRERPVRKPARVQKFMGARCERQGGEFHLVRREADEAERMRHLSDTLFDAFQAEGLWHLLTPAALGGSELSWSEAMAVAESVSRIDGSTGWCLMVAGIQNGGCGALIRDPGCAEVFERGIDTSIAGQGIPRGCARTVDGGYMIRHDWS